MLAVVLLVAAGGAATAQTIVVNGAPAGSKVEVLLNASTVGSATASASGSATIAARPPAGAKPQVDANVFVDGCDGLVRVLIVERVMAAPVEEAGCARREVTGLFLVRTDSTLVVNVGGANPTLVLRQGRYDPRASPGTLESPTGLVLSAGGDFTVYRDAAVVACGTGADCTGNGSGIAYTAGVGVWFLPFLAAEATYVKAGQMKADGSGDKYKFNSTLDADVLTVAGLFGIPAGPMRVYGKVGGTYHQATFYTTETTEDRTIKVGDVTTTVPGGTQTLGYTTNGRGWMFGGGVEIWLNRWFGGYGEFQWARLKGKELDGGEAIMDERLLVYMVGARLRIGR